MESSIRYRKLAACSRAEVTASLVREATNQNAEDVVVLNPRREDWDASWRQSMDEPPFVEQVEWELTAQERAAVVAMYFEPSTQAPISLLELGLAARSGKLLVCCPEGYWRKGNVDVVCRRYGVPMLKDLTALVAEVRQVITR